MKNISRWGLGLSAAVAAFGLMAVAAEAQTTATTPAPTAKPVTPPAAKAPAASKTAPAATAAKKEKKPPSECAKLPEADCKAKAGCIWVVPKKATDKNGKPLTAHCQKPGGFAAKKAAAPTAGQTGMGGMGGMAGTPAKKAAPTAPPAPKQ